MLISVANLLTTGLLIYGKSSKAYEYLHLLNGYS